MARKKRQERVVVEEEKQMEVVPSSSSVISPAALTPSSSSSPAAAVTNNLKGKSMSQKKNAKRKIAKQRKMEEEASVADGEQRLVEATLGGATKSSSTSVPFESMDDDQQMELGKIREKYQSVLSVTSLDVQKAAAIALLQRIDEHLGRKLKKPPGRNGAESLLASLNEARADTALDGSEQANQLAFLSEEYQVARNWEGLRKFQTALKEIRLELEERLSGMNRQVEDQKTHKKTKDAYRRVIALKKDGGGFKDKRNAAGEIKSCVVDVPPEVCHAVLGFQAVMRRVKKRLCCDICKPVERRPNSLQITALEADFKKCVDELRLIDFSGKQVIPMDHKLVGAVIGRGGYTAQAIEDEFNVYLAAEKAQLTVLGSQKEVTEAVKHIHSTVQSGSRNEDIIIPVVVALQLVAGGAKLVREMEKDTRSQITVSLTKQKKGASLSGVVVLADSKETCKVTLRGVPEVISAASKLIFQYVANSTILELPLSRELADQFLSSKDAAKEDSSSPLLKDGTTMRTGAQTIKQTIRKHGTVVVASSTGFTFCGSKATVTKIKEDIEKIIVSWSQSVVAVCIQREQLKALTQEKNREISQATGTDLTVSRYRNDGTVEVAIRGDDDESIEVARQAIVDLIKERGVREKEAVNDEVVQLLCRNRCAKINELESSTDPKCSISLDRSGKSITVVGTAQAVKLIMGKISQLKSSDCDEATTTVSVAAATLGRLIGRNGQTILSIRNKSGARVEVVEEKSAVCITGTAESVARAQALVEKVLSVQRDGTINGGETPNNNKTTTASDRSPTSHQQQQQREEGHNNNRDRGGRKKLTKVARVDCEVEFPRLKASPTQGKEEESSKSKPPANKAESNDEKNVTVDSSVISGCPSTGEVDYEKEDTTAVNAISTAE